MVDYAKVKRELFAAVEAAVWRELRDHSRGPIGDALTLILDAGKADGSLRGDVDATDVIVLIGYLSRADDTSAATEARDRRLLSVVVDGLRTRD